MHVPCLPQTARPRLTIEPVSSAHQLDDITSAPWSIMSIPTWCATKGKMSGIYATTVPPFTPYSRCQSSKQAFKTNAELCKPF